MVAIEPPMEKPKMGFVNEEDFVSQYNQVVEERNRLLREFFKKTTQLEIEQERAKFVKNLALVIRADAARRKEIVMKKFMATLDLYRELKEEGHRLVLNETFWNKLRNKMFEIKTLLDKKVNEVTLQKGLETLSKSSSVIREW